MPRGKPVAFGPFLFPNKKEATEAFRTVLYRNNEGGDLTGEDLLLAEWMLRIHPLAAEKLANGYQGMFVAPEPTWGTPCFWLRDDQGGVVDVSFQVAISPEKGQPSLHAAGRYLIKDDVEDYRRRRFETRPVRCAVSGKELRENEAHVDHAPPETFDAIVQAYKAEHGTPALRHEGTVDLFEDPADAKRFKKFHDDRRVFRLVHWRVNLSDLRKQAR